MIGRYTGTVLSSEETRSPRSGRFIDLLCEGGNQNTRLVEVETLWTGIQIPEGYVRTGGSFLVENEREL